MLKRLDDERKKYVINTLFNKYNKFKIITLDLVNDYYDQVTNKRFEDEYEVIYRMDIMINTLLCDFIKHNPDDELIFDYLEYYYNRCSNIMIKLGIKGASLDDCMMDAIEKYDGSDTFNSFFIKYLKTRANNGELTRVKEEKKINPFIKTAHDLNLLNNISLDDPLLVRYVFMKFGYGNKYFTDEEIRTELGISKFDCDVMFEKMILIVSDIQFKKSSKVKKY